MRKKVDTVVKKGGGIEKKRGKQQPQKASVDSSYDNQSIPTIEVRDRVIPLVFVKPNKNYLDWSDLDESGESAVTNDNLDTILFKDKENIICLLATKCTQKLKKNVVGGLSKEWLYNYSILYIYTNATHNMKEINFREKEIRNLNRMVTEGTNIKRFPNNAKADFGTWFPVELNHTCDEGERSHEFLFQVRYGHKRSASG